MEPMLRIHISQVVKKPHLFKKTTDLHHTIGRIAEKNVRDLEHEFSPNFDLMKQVVPNETILNPQCLQAVTRAKTALEL